MRLRLQRLRRSGFTLVEAMISIALAALAGSVLLVGINASVRVTDDAMHETIAMGIAEQMLDEIAANPRGDGTTRTATYRTGLADIDDYDGYVAAPVDVWGQPLGKDDGQGGLRPATFQANSAFLDRCQVRVSMTMFNDQGTAVSKSGSVYCYTVVVTVVDTGQNSREVAKLRRVVTYVQ